MLKFGVSMRRIVLVLYNIFFFPLLLVGVFVASLINQKIRKGLKGRNKLIKKIQHKLALFETGKPKIWIHVSSYGEFLQVTPVLNQLKQLNPDLFIIISFFSPSGYENISNQPPIDFKCYLPIDSYFQAKKFISLISPQVAIIVRHDIWPNFVWRLKQEKIPLILIDASIPRKSFRRLPIIKRLNKYLFNAMEAILAISEAQAAQFRQLVDDPAKIIVIGDTKYDQVFERSQNLSRIAPLLSDQKLNKKKVIVVGSSWHTDEDYLIPAFQELHQKFEDLAIILAPHEPTQNRITQIEQRLNQAQLSSTRLSQFKPGQFDSNCLIVDQIGLLANIYYLGRIAFVGGSFHYKIHNVLEPAVYGIPVAFGPKMMNSSEAQNLLEHDAAILVNSIQDIIDVISELLKNPEQAKEYGERAKQLVMQNVGSSEKIARFLLQYL